MNAPRSLALVLLMATARSASGEATLSPESVTFFESKVRPLLVERCYSCHAHDADQVKADYTLDTAAGLLEGGASGDPALVPGEPEHSPLFARITSDDPEFRMPPKEALSAEEIAAVEAWIRMGAPDPRTRTPAEAREAADAAKRRDHWAFHPPESAVPPEVRKAEWPANWIDQFTLAAMEDAGIEPNPDASPTALLRRLSFDLTGLPPRPETVRAFEANPSAAAYERLVDRFLRSPAFGERWGRHWLDVARYGESSGMEFNFTYPHAWPYRDWVIDAFNRDTPYDAFITQQLAGDLLPASSPEERERNLLATGFLAVGQKRHNAGRSTFVSDMVDDQIQVTSSAFLGLTAGCARCHDHKFDPIPTADYYAMAGIFQSSDTLYGTKPIKYSNHPTELIPFGPDAAAKHIRFQEWDGRMEEALKGKRDADQKKQDARLALDPDLSDEEKTEALADVQKLVDDAQAAIDVLEDERPEPPLYAMGMRDGKPVNLPIAVGGNPGKKGDVANRGFFSAVSLPHTTPPPADASGRLELAAWITDAKNPLTARVMTNRVWSHLFGIGLVKTVNNFGRLGEAPSHPELLDALAQRFQANGWSTKNLIREMVMSRTYRLSAAKNSSAMVADPDNRLLWRAAPKRLEVEALRDAMLTISGALDRTIHHGSPVTALGQQLARGVDNDKLNPNLAVRSVYLPVVRSYLPDVYEEFDFPSPGLVAGARATTNTAQQALYLLNSDFTLDQAEGLAETLLRSNQLASDEDRIEEGYIRALSRRPLEQEVQWALEFIQGALEDLSGNEQDPASTRRTVWSAWSQTLFLTPEFRYLLADPNAPFEPKLGIR